MATSLEVKTVGAMSLLWDIRQPVRTLAEDIVRIRYQETTSEDIDDFMCAAVTAIFIMRKPMRLFYLVVVTSCVYKCSVNPITNPNPFYSHSKKLQCDDILSILFRSTVV
jgi:hypothetical protein